MQYTRYLLPTYRNRKMIYRYTTTNSDKIAKIYATTVAVCTIKSIHISLSTFRVVVAESTQLNQKQYRTDNSTCTTIESISKMIHRTFINPTKNIDRNNWNFFQFLNSIAYDADRCAKSARHVTSRLPPNQKICLLLTFTNRRKQITICYITSHL